MKPPAPEPPVPRSRSAQAFRTADGTANAHSRSMGEARLLDRSDRRAQQSQSVRLARRSGRSWRPRAGEVAQPAAVTVPGVREQAQANLAVRAAESLVGARAQRVGLCATR